MNKKQFIIILLIIIFLSIAFASFIYSSYYIIDVKYINATFIVQDKIGLNIDTDALHFGMVMPGGSGERAIEITNTYSHKIRVEISKHGELAEWISISEPFFVLEEKQTKKVGFAAIAPYDATLGNYTGYVKIVFKRTSFF